MLQMIDFRMIQQNFSFQRTENAITTVTNSIQMSYSFKHANELVQRNFDFTKIALDRLASQSPSVTTTRLYSVARRN